MADTAAGLTRLESFPFDSKLDGYDDYGYPVYDRAVGAAMLRATFRQFFSDGIFGTPATALKMAKADGLRVTVSPGIAVIRGAMGGVEDEAATVTLDSAPPQGAVTYAVMLRYDENDEYRSLYLRVAKGEAGAGAPGPDDSPGVRELRLGTVAVPSGATDLAGATLTDERGTELCPYAAPFERIDMSWLVDEARSISAEAYAQFMEYLDRNKEFIAAAMDGTVAGNLQNQINKLADTLTNAEFMTYVTGKGA